MRLKQLMKLRLQQTYGIEAPLSRGEIQYLNNHELGHYRSDFFDHDDETKKDIFFDFGIEPMAIKHMMVKLLKN